MCDYEWLWWIGLGLLAVGMLVFDLGPFLVKRFKKRTKDRDDEYWAADWEDD